MQVGRSEAVRIRERNSRTSDRSGSANPQGMQMKLPYPLAERTVKQYVCAICWGNLTRDKVDHDTDDVSCQQCGDAGFVTRTYTDGRKGESGGELSEVLEVLYEAGEMPRPPRRPTKQIMSDLGY